MSPKANPKPRGGKSKAQQAKDAKTDASLLTAKKDKGPGTFVQRAMARVLSEKGLSTRQIGEKLGCSGAHVSKMLNWHEDEIAVAVSERLTEGLPARLAGILDRIMAEFETRDMTDAPIHHLAMLFGILFDKHRLATGKSTGNVSFLVKVQAQSETAVMEQIKSGAPQIKAPCPADIAPDTDVACPDPCNHGDNQHG